MAKSLNRRGLPRLFCLLCAQPIIQKVREPRLISDWLYCFQLVVLYRALGIIVTVADQIVGSGFSSTELRNKAELSRKSTLDLVIYFTLSSIFLKCTSSLCN